MKMYGRLAQALHLVNIQKMLLFVPPPSDGVWTLERGVPASPSGVAGLPTFQKSGQSTGGGGGLVRNLWIPLREAASGHLVLSLWPVPPRALHPGPLHSAVKHRSPAAVRAVCKGLARASAFMRTVLWLWGLPSTSKHPSGTWLLVSMACGLDGT